MLGAKLFIVVEITFEKLYFFLTRCLLTFQLKRRRIYLPYTLHLHISSPTPENGAFFPFLFSVFHLTQVFVIWCFLMLDRESQQLQRMSQQRPVWPQTLSQRTLSHTAHFCDWTQHLTEGNKDTRLKNTKKGRIWWRCNRNKWL